ncbi:hypothetical protein J6590_034366 [Homalodisca vitripennis]|nr:hypothetical protein J6590_034366 [Homalodisca vitripennis]
MLTCWCVPLLSALTLATIADPIGESERYKVVIIGAGVSGFSAAATLLENNVSDIVVLEASSRIGGRIRTVDFGASRLWKPIFKLHPKYSWDYEFNPKSETGFRMDVFAPHPYNFISKSPTNQSGLLWILTILPRILTKSKLRLRDFADPPSAVNDSWAGFLFHVAK